VAPRGEKSIRLHGVNPVGFTDRPTGGEDRGPVMAVMVAKEGAQLVVDERKHNTT